MPLADFGCGTHPYPRFSFPSIFWDALKCYRVGAFRAAISSTWVALAYDPIRKYRELDGLGDAEAQVFLQNWDVSVPANNIAKLLELEDRL